MIAATLPQVAGKLTADAPLAPLVWFKSGGTAEWLFEPRDLADLQGFMRGDLAGESSATLPEPSRIVQTETMVHIQGHGDTDWKPTPYQTRSSRRDQAQPCADQQHSSHHTSGHHDH